MMLVRKGLTSIILKRFKQLDLAWLLKQCYKYFAIKKAIARNDGRIACGPIVAHFFCTSQCNSNCPMCDIPSRKGEVEINMEQGLKIIDELADLGISGISFTGGEPLLRPDIFYFIKYARSYGLDTILATNGLELEKYALDVVAAGPTVINVSIDGPNSSIHEKSRGCPGAFDKTIGGIRAVKQQIDREGADIQIVASCVISQNNINDLDNIISLCKSLKINRIIFCPLHEFGKGNCAVPPMQTAYNIQSFFLKHKDRGMIDNSDYYLRFLSEVISGEIPPAGCRAGYTTIIIDYQGKAYPCKCYFENRHPLADSISKNRTLKQIWYSPVFDGFRKTCGQCRGCFLTVNREFDSLFT